MSTRHLLYAFGPIFLIGAGVTLGIVIYRGGLL